MKMNENFDLLIERIIDANKHIDGEGLKLTLSGIKGNVISIGTGGSYATSIFASKVFGVNNEAFSLSLYPRNLLYMNLSGLNEVCAFTYSGKTPSIIKALEKCGQHDIRKTVFTHDEEKLRQYLSINDNDQVINYSGNMPAEHSFISVAATLIPMSILLRYSLDLSYEELQKLINKLNNESLQYIEEQVKDIDFKELLLEKPHIEIFTGDNTYTAGHILESNLTETGMAYTILHEKNHYCHGRSILNYNHHTPILIYLINGKEKEQDRILLDEFLPILYDNILIIKSNYEGILGEYDLAMKAMYLSKRIVEDLGKDLSEVDHPKGLKKIYSFNGEM
jgi:fructoselysine-6-P-deglycase FrlB-like protein